MLNRTRTAVLAMVGAATSAGLVLAAPVAANAAENGDIFAFHWDSGTLGSVDPATGAFTSIGPATDINFTGLDVDPTTGLAYAVSYDELCALYSVDLTTGTVSVIGPIAPFETGCTAFDIDDQGVARVAYDDGSGGSVLGEVDLSTGLFSLLSGAPRLSALATDPTTDTLYAVTYDGDLVFAVDRETGNGTPAGDVDNGVYAADFDRAGLVWGTNFDELLIVNTADWSATVIGPLSEGGGDRSGEALTVFFRFPASAPAPEPQLAATGYDVSGALGAATALTLLGVLGIAVARRRTATA